MWSNPPWVWVAEIGCSGGFPKLSEKIGDGGVGEGADREEASLALTEIPSASEAGNYYFV